MAAQGINPIPNFLFTQKAKQDPTSYAVNIDAAITALAREAGKFAPMSWPGQFGTSLSAMIAPGHYYNGTALSEVGARTTGNTTSGSASVASVGTTVGISVGMMVLGFTYTALTFTANSTNGSNLLASPSSTAGLFVGMSLYGAGIPAGSTITAIGASVTISQNATATASGITVLSSGLSPVVPVSTIVTAIGSGTLTLSQNATATVTGANLFICQPLGTRTTGTTTTSSPNVTAIPSTRGMFAGMNITGSGIPGSTTILSVVDDNNIIMSANASPGAGGTVLTVTVPVPGANSRIDWITVNQLTGRIGWVQGTPAATPVPPTLPAGQLPCAQLLLTNASTSIGTADLSDVRDLSSMGMQAGAFSTISTVPTVAMALFAGVNL